MDEKQSILFRIRDRKREEVAALYASGKAQDYRMRALSGPLAKSSFYDAISNGLNLIAEFKRASPSKGDIRPGAEPEEIVRMYERCGASAVSVLTDSDFKGSLEDLARVKKVVNVPVLRKDFIIDPVQIYEARVHGADAILLISALLNPEQIRRYIVIAGSLGMDCLVESHTEEDLRKAAEGKARIYGINNRNLHNPKEVDIETTFNLLPYVPRGGPLVAESGVYPSNVQRFREVGRVNALLVGDAIMSAEKNPTLQDMERTISELIGRTNP